jgi:ATP-dependent RNA helicase DeaD
MIHLGTDDGFSREELVEILENECGLSTDSLDKLKVIKRRSFIKVPHEQANAVLDKLKNVKINGKRVRVTLSNDEPFPSRRPERFGGRDDRRSGFRRGGDDRRGGHDRGGFGERRRRH